jgi:hypothetical protein
VRERRPLDALVRSTTHRRAAILAAGSCVLAVAVGFGSVASAHGGGQRGGGGAAVSGPLAAQIASPTIPTTSPTIPTTSPTKSPTTPAATAPSSSTSVRNGASVGPANPAGISSAAGATGTQPAIASGSPPAGSGQWGSGGAAVSGPLAPQTASRTMQSSTPLPTAPSSTTSLREGAYVGPADPAGIASFAGATGTKPTIASDYLPASSGWSGMDGANGSLSWLFAQGWQGTGYTLSLGVPIIPTDAANAPVGSLAAGATGAYNAYFVTLGRTLVAAGEANADLRLGWEFDGNWYAWDALTPAAESNYARYFQQIVTAMRSVPGEAFKFVWNPDASAFVGQSVVSNYNVDLAYPGSAYVDYVGLDVYDQSWVMPLTPANAWTNTTLPALSAARSFAAAQSEPIAVSEWGVTIRPDGHGLGDDPLYVEGTSPGRAAWRGWRTTVEERCPARCRRRRR